MAVTKKNFWLHVWLLVLAGAIISLVGWGLKWALMQFGVKV